MIIVGVQPSRENLQIHSSLAEITLAPLCLAAPVHLLCCTFVYNCIYTTPHLPFCFLLMPSRLLQINLENLVKKN